MWCRKALARSGEHDHVAAPLDAQFVHLLDRASWPGTARSGTRKSRGCRPGIAPLRASGRRRAGGRPSRRGRPAAASGSGCCTGRSGRCASAPRSARGIRAPGRAASSVAQRTAIESGRKAFTPRTQALHRARQVGVEVDHLLERVHAGVGAAGAGGRQVDARELLRARFPAGPAPCSGRAASGSRSSRVPSYWTPSAIRFNSCPVWSSLHQPSFARISLALPTCAVLPPLMTSSSSSRAPSLSPISW